MQEVVDAADRPGPNQGSPSGRSTDEECLIAATERDMSAGPLASADLSAPFVTACGDAG